MTDSTSCQLNAPSCSLSAWTIPGAVTLSGAVTLPGTGPLVGAGEIRLSEILSALSLSLDLTQGQPAGHAMRSALIGMRLADMQGLSAADHRALFYALLLKDVGCSSNAAKMAYLFGADEHHVKHESKLVDWSRAGEKIKYVWRTCAPGGSTIDKLLRIGALAKSGPRGERMIVEVRCERGAAIARELDFPAATSEAIRALDELWNGKGHPRGLKRDAIPLLARICNLAQTVEIFFRTYGRQAALEMAAQRRGTWFDPALVDVLLSLKDDEAFWTDLACENPAAALARWEPQHGRTVADDALRRDVRRAGLLHDIGKLGVSSLVLDKPGKLNDDEWIELRRHALYSQQILSQLPAFALLSDLASAHHERLDGRGYHRGVPAERLHWVSRVLAVADIYEALSANRPYRAGMPWEKIQTILREERGRGLDAECVDALEKCHAPFTAETRVNTQLEQVDKLLCEVADI